MSPTRPSGPHAVISTQRPFQPTQQALSIKELELSRQRAIDKLVEQDMNQLKNKIWIEFEF